MGNKVKDFFKDILQRLVFLCIYLFTTCIAEFAMKMIATVFTGSGGCMHEVKYSFFQSYKNANGKGQSFVCIKPVRVNRVVTGNEDFYIQEGMEKLVSFYYCRTCFFVVLLLLPFGWKVVHSLIALPGSYIEFTERIWKTEHRFFQVARAGQNISDHNV